MTRPRHVCIPGVVVAGLGLLLLCGGVVGADEPAMHWAFVSPVRPEPPKVMDPSWVRQPIDAFVLARLESEGLRPAPEASRTVLARRLSFDLIGLPPSPEEVQLFVEDPAPDAYEKLVERLLASPHYGEKQAHGWLDLARYADSDGFEFDQARPEMWRYRDWVVSAFNRDLPFDRFLTLQLAGDEVAADDPEAIVATGFNRLYPDMVDLNDQALRRQNALNDMTETTASVFLGLTMGCARCHDHKFDPIPQKDFYAIQAFFTPAQFRDDLVIAGEQERKTHGQSVQKWREEVHSARKAILQIEATARGKIAVGRPPGLSDEVVKAFEKPEDSRTFEEVGLVFEAIERDPRIPPKSVMETLDPEAREQSISSRKRLADLVKNPPAPLPHARGLCESSTEAPPTYLLRRGEFTTRGPEVLPSFPQSVTRGSVPEIHPTEHSTGRRTALARWLTRPDHPLTARVLVNRLWQGHFGRGIVATPSDFGIMGEEPTDPALLDWLATEIVAREWSLKAMHRLIVTSATYRQSSAAGAEALRADPENSLLSRHSRIRIEGEAIRDAMLSVSGRLNPAIGGPCVFPELPGELTRLSGKGAIWPVSVREEDRNRRSLYVFLRRNLRYPLFEAFDKPDTNTSCARRPVTTIAPQALSLLNGNLPSDSARALAERVVRVAGEDRTGQVERAYRLALGRSPDAEEKRLAVAYLDTSPLSDLCLALFNLNEFLYID